MIGLGILCAAALARQADPANYLSDMAKVMRTDWPNNRTVNIVCHGHSVPAGYFKTPEVNTFGAYPFLLHQLLAKKYPHAVINVIVTAIGGENTEGGARRFASDVLALHPDLITIDYALNDRGIGLVRAKEAWVAMIDAATKANVKLILLTPTPDQSAKLDDPNDPLNLQADQIRQLASRYGVGLVDSLEAFKRKIVKRERLLASLMAQVNHPNQAGHQLVADETSRSGVPFETSTILYRNAVIGCESRRLARRIHPEKDADRGRNNQRDHDGRAAHDRIPSAELGQYDSSHDTSK